MSEFDRYNEEVCTECGLEKFYHKTEIANKFVRRGSKTDKEGCSKYTTDKKE